jgi:hypothetical protein
VKQQRQYIIMIRAVAGPSGFQTTLTDYNTKTPISIDQPMVVRPGDTVSWFLRVQAGSNYFTPPFQVSFFQDSAKTIPNTTFFGKASVHVGAGGSSDVLHVITLDGDIHYSVDAQGFGTILDPEMQTGDGTAQHNEKTRASYTVTWNYPGPDITCVDGHGTPQTFPVSLEEGDNVSFTAPAGTPDSASIFFPAGENFWASPFALNQQSYPIAVGVNPTPNMAKDYEDPAGSTFSFQGIAGAQSSDTYQFVLD